MRLSPLKNGILLLSLLVIVIGVSQLFSMPIWEPPDCGASPPYSWAWGCRDKTNGYYCEDVCPEWCLDPPPDCDVQCCKLGEDDYWCMYFCF